MSTIRIVIADDHAVVRRGLRQFFLEEEGFEVVAECDDGFAAIEAVHNLKPDIALLDLRMPGIDGLEVARRLRNAGSDSPVVLLVASITDDEVIEAMRLGVKGIVLKEMAPSLLVQSVRKVAAGGVWVEKQSVTRAVERLIHQESTGREVRVNLTPRELDVVRMVAEGYGNREIGERLFISEATVKTHLHAIYEKLGVKGRVQLSKYASDHRLL